MVNLIDGRDSIPRDFLGSDFGFEFGLSSSDGFAVAAFFDTMTVNEAETDTTKVTFEKVTGIGLQKLVVYGTFAAYPANPGDVPPWRATVDATLVTTARFEKGKGDIIEFTFDTPRRVDVFDTSVNDILAGDDKIFGTNHIDWIGGKAGDDVLLGGGGNDGLDGGADDDLLKGQGGHDRLTAGTGNDRLLGGAGNDQLFSTSGNDVLLGGGGNDYIVANVTSASDKRVLKGQAGDDIIQLGLSKLLIEPASDFDSNEKRAFSSTFGVNGGPGADSAFLPFDAGVSDLSLSATDATGSFVLAGGSRSPGLRIVADSVEVVEIDIKLVGKFRLDLTQLSGGVSGRVQTDPFGDFVSFGPLDGIVFKIFDDDFNNGPRTFTTTPSRDILDFSGVASPGKGFVVNGGGGNDKIMGTNRADTLNGEKGNDKLIGGNGGDRLNGGSGDDFINGGAGKDTTIDGTGKDTVEGGAGADLFKFIRDGTRDVVQKFEVEKDTLFLAGVTKKGDMTITDTAKGDVLIKTATDSLLIKESAVFDVDADDFSAGLFLFDT